ncbi:hypothetical protein MMC14_003928 [Varicellaria rhodocarpa]|nr:hypothetical protein [Varicellaria rhodocarpa]
MAPVTINGNTVEPSTVSNGSRPYTSRDSNNTNYIYVQGDGHMTPEQKRELQSLNVTIQEYVGNDTYLCRYEPGDLGIIRTLPFVGTANVYHKVFKTTSQLKDSIREGGTGSTHTIDILLHKSAEGPEHIATLLKNRPGVDASSISIDHRQIRVTVGAQEVPYLETLDSVKTIERVRPFALFNNIARTDLEVDMMAKNLLFQGSGQVITMADTGFDKGDKVDVHPAFKDKFHSRIVGLYAIARDTADDPHGHGTHVAGSIIGNGDSTLMGGSIQGTAPEAALVVQSMMDPFGDLQPPQNLWDLFREPYNDYVSRIHSNSWGSKWDGAQENYNDNARTIDRFIWHNPDAVICFAAGNDAQKPLAGVSQIGGSSAAKNCITVGASESSRPSVDNMYSPGKKNSNDPATIADFSSRGPTLEGRIKPDVVAPGTAILSAASRNVDLSAKIRTEYGPCSDTNWLFMSGTSQATPLVAGCAAILREALLTAGHQSPSAALIKALLINGAVDLQGQHGFGDMTVAAPSYAQGFGRVNLNNSLIIPGRSSEEGFEDTKALLAEGETSTTIVVIPSERNGTILKVTLVYADRPGETIQNNLTLKVTAKDGTEKLGNEGYGTENNVEQVFWRNPPPGQVTVKVTAERIAIPSDRQSFALVWKIY